MDGFEEMFAANHLGPFLLTNLLVELLQSAVQVSGSAAPLRLFIWLVSSQAQEIAENVLQVVMSPESKKTTGKFLYRGKEIEAHAYAYDALHNKDYGR